LEQVEYPSFQLVAWDPYQLLLLVDSGAFVGSVIQAVFEVDVEPSRGIGTVLEVVGLVLKIVAAAIGVSVVMVAVAAVVVAVVVVEAVVDAVVQYFYLVQLL